MKTQKFSKRTALYIRSLEGCILAIKSYHGYDYCPTNECAACQSRLDAEEALKLLYGDK